MERCFREESILTACWICFFDLLFIAFVIIIIHNGLPQGTLGFSGGASGKEPACQCRRHKRHRFGPRVGKIPWRKAWQLTAVLLPGESHGQRSLAGYGPVSQRVDMTETTQHADTWYM